MGNQSSVLADMVYRVFPDLDPAQYDLDQLTAPNGLGGLHAQRPHTARQQPPPAKASFRRLRTLSFSHSTDFGKSTPTSKSPKDLPVKAAAAAYRAKNDPKPMGIVAFEVASLTLRVLDISDRLAPESIRLLKRRIKEVLVHRGYTTPRAVVVFHLHLIVCLTCTPIQTWSNIHLVAEETHGTPPSQTQSQPKGVTAGTP